MWQDKAACIGMSDLFLNQGGLAKKKSICATCEVKQDCLNMAMSLEDYEPATMYGGFTGTERRKLAEGTVWS